MEKGNIYRIFKRKINTMDSHVAIIQLQQLSVLANLVSLALLSPFFGLENILKACFRQRIIDPYILRCVS